MFDLGTSFLASVSRDPNAVAVVDGNIRLSYRDWYAKTAFTPVALLKLIPLAEAAVVTAGHQRAALRQATQGATALTTSSSVVTGMINTRFRASSAAGPAAGFAAPVAATAAAVGAARNRATSSFAAMSSIDDGGGGEPAAPAPIRSSGRPAPANVGGNGGATSAGSKPMKLPDLNGEGSDA
jgi:2-furoate---CoA ligase